MINPVYPPFLATFDDFEAHLAEHFEGLHSVEKGTKFATFVSRLLPFIIDLKEFGEASLSEKKSHDDGIDIVSEPIDSGQRLYIQAKLKISKKEDIDSIFSKFEAFESKVKNKISQISLFPSSDMEPSPIFGIATSTKIDGILRRYTSSSMSSRKYCDILRAENRFHVIDGPKIYQILHNAYGKAFNVPSEVRLKSQAGWLKSGSVWLGFLAGQDLRSLYAQHGDAIFFENIRDYLGRTSGQVAPDQRTVNEEIAVTIRDQPNKLLERNNGLTMKARAVKPEGKFELILQEGSIVNGCQTTMSLVEPGVDVKDCILQIKVIESADAWDVAKSANYQNTIDKIELDLAKFLRPQIVRMYASGAGIDVEAKHPTTALALLGDFYKGKIQYDEVRHLYIGLMSNSPNNIGDQLYTKLRSDLVAGFAENTADQQLLLETLMKIVVATRTAIARCDELFGNEDYMEPFTRVFHDRRPQYRMFLAILSISALLRIDLSSRLDNSAKELSRMKKFVSDAREILETDEPKYVRTYARALQTFAADARAISNDDNKIKQHLSNLLRRGFKGLYATLVMMIDSDAKIANL